MVKFTKKQEEILKSHFDESYKTNQKDLKEMFKKFELKGRLNEEFWRG